MKQFLYMALAMFLIGSTFVACSDDDDSEDPEEEFTDPIPLDSLETSAVTFTNPVIYADIPDPCVVRVGSDYYMSTTSMHHTPGVPILHSTDLVGWEIIGYVYDTIDDSRADFTNNTNLYAGGCWATSLAYYDGRFYCLWNNYTSGISYISSAADPAGPWTIEQNMGKLYYDASLLFDDDGTPYIFATGTNSVIITKLNSDLTASGTEYTCDTGGYDGEGYQVRKVNGTYYLFMMYWPDGGNRSVVCCKSTSVDGPYSARLVLSGKIDGETGDGVSQGNIIDTPDGDWWGMFFTDMGAVGRCPVLIPCSWTTQGWPSFGNSDGNVDSETESPFQDSKISQSVVSKSDEFEDETLGLTWQWNHNPLDGYWSLTDRSGYLRLTTGHVASDFWHARNTLTCRTLGPACTGTISIDFSGMKNGDYTGLSVMQYQSAFVGVKKVSGKYYVYMSTGTQLGTLSEVEVSDALDQTTVGLKIMADFETSTATFYYSLKNNEWTQIGNSFTMVYDNSTFVGNRFAIYNYSTSSYGGYVDVDYFHIKRY